VTSSCMSLVRPFEASDIDNDDCGIPVTMNTIPVLQLSMVG